MVSTALMANGLWWNAIQVQAALCGAHVEPRPSREEAASALANLYRCADGRWFLLNLVQDERDWPSLVRAIEQPELLNDPRFATAPARRANARALVSVLDKVFAARPWEKWRGGPRAPRPTSAGVGAAAQPPRAPHAVARGAHPPHDDPHA